jgi:hypothetical protein
VDEVLLATEAVRATIPGIRDIFPPEVERTLFSRLTMRNPSCAPES